MNTIQPASFKFGYYPLDKRTDECYFKTEASLYLHVLDCADWQRNEINVLSLNIIHPDIINLINETYNINCVETSILENLNFKNNTFQTVIGINLFAENDKRISALEEIFRVIEPCGILLLCETFSSLDDIKKFKEELSRDFYILEIENITDNIGNSFYFEYQQNKKLKTLYDRCLEYKFKRKYFLNFVCGKQ